MHQREINRRVNSIKKSLIATGFTVEPHNENSFVNNFGSNEYEIYITYYDGWTIKIVDLQDKNDGRNVICGSLSFWNKCDNREFFNSLFRHLLFKARIKAETKTKELCQKELSELVTRLA